MGGLLQGGGGEAQSRLRQQGLAWAPLAGNVATLACYASSQALVQQLTDDPDLATLPLAALLLLLSQVPINSLFSAPRRSGLISSFVTHGAALAADHRADPRELIFWARQERLWVVFADAACAQHLSAEGSMLQWAQGPC